MEADLNEKKLYNEAPVQVGIQMDWRQGGRDSVDEVKEEGEEDQKPHAESAEAKKVDVTTPRTRDVRRIIQSVDDLADECSSLNLMVEFDISHNPKIMGCNIAKFISNLS